MDCVETQTWKNSITVTAQSHRWLAVNVELPNFSAAIVVAHAPPEVANELVKKQWWEEISQIVLNMAPRSGQVWLLIDANGRLGSNTSVAVGFVPRSDAEWKWESTAFFVVGGQVCLRQTPLLKRERPHGLQLRAMHRA